MNRNTFIVYSEDGNVIYNTGLEVIKKPKRTKKIVHPILEQLRKYNTDKRWDIFLFKASQNIIEKGFSIQVDSINYSNGPKQSFSHVIENSETGLENLKRFIKNKGGIMLDENIIDHSDYGDTITDWKSYGKLKYENVYEYVNFLIKANNLSACKGRILHSNVKLAIAAGYINNTNIIIKNSSIVNIEPIEWNDEMSSFDINTTKMIVKKSRARNIFKEDSTDNTTTCLSFGKKYNVINTIDKRWDKFLHSIYT